MIDEIDNPEFESPEDAGNNYGDEEDLAYAQPPESLDAILFDESAYDAPGVEGIHISKSVGDPSIDEKRVEKYKDEFEKVGQEHHLPPALLAGIASRESHVGNALGLGDNEPGWGDDNNGYGMMQVDKRSHDIDQSDGPTGHANIEQGAQILEDILGKVKKSHPDWTEAQQLREATARYNGGKGDGLRNFDKGTTGGDYSADVWARAQYFEDHAFHEGHDQDPHQ